MIDAALAIALPYPPSTNAIWRHIGTRVLLSAEGRRYREAVAWQIKRSGYRTLDGRLTVTVTTHCPDKRRRDLDNVLKAALDALTHAGLWEDDSQIDDLRVIRGDIVPAGRLDVAVSENPRP